MQVLKARLRKGTALNTSYIFAGGSGQGKTTLARIVARAALCPNMDKETCEPCNTCDQCRAILDGIPCAFDERDAANGGAISIVREMLDNLPYATPYNAPIRIWLFDEAHRLSSESQDVLLKPIEEKKIVAIFCTTEGNKIAGPIYGRCEEYAIRRVTRDQVLARAKYILDCEKVEYQEEALLTVIDHAGGHVRNVINRLESIAQLGPVSVDAVRENLNLRYVGAFYETLLCLGDDTKVAQLIENMCEFMSPEDVASGLSEAAMNSFRLANGMRADFTYTDRQLAQKVHERFGNSLLQVAERFLRSRNLTKVSLMCEALTVVQNGSVAGPVALAPVAVSAPVLAPSTFEPTPREAILPPPPNPPPTPTPAIAPPAPPVASTPKVSATMSSTGFGADGVPIGLPGADRNALTTMDQKAIGDRPARNMGGKPPTLNFSASPHREDEDLLPTDWKRIFERFWRREIRVD